MENYSLTIFSFISIIVLAVVYFFLLSEKINKVIVAVLGAVFLILMQVFKTSTNTSQENAFEFISHNLDVLGFVVGMMMLVGIVKKSGLFEAIAIGLAKLVKGNPKALLIVLGCLTLVMTTFLSNIPTILIVTPVLLILIRELKLPYLPYIFTVVTMANIGGAMTPISDPTTYYQAKTAGLGFAEVVTNSGLIVIIASIISLIYILFIFRKSLNQVVTNENSVSLFKPLSAIQNIKVLIIGVPILITVITLMICKEFIQKQFGITIDNATVTIGGAFLSILIFHKEPGQIFRELIDWEILFFFSGLFIVVGALEFTYVIPALAKFLVEFSNGSITTLTLIISTGSVILSTFIDNVPYNITMVGAIQEMEKAGIFVYPLWWALNLGTSIGGACSPIGAACNVIIFGRAEREKMHVNFVKYLLIALPLGIFNSFVTFGILWIRYFR